VKKIIASLLLAATSTAAYAQKQGDTVTPDALGKEQWIRGEAPKEWEPGKVYILECWATWCGPCLAMIPHVDELHDKYQEKGLRVIGVNVWERDKDKEAVADFVKSKGKGMSYPIVYTTKDGAFLNEWLKPAEVAGIPHAFVVKDGKVVLTTHPSRLSDEVITALLEGGDAQDKALASLEEAKKRQEASRKVIMDALKAFQGKEKDVAAMEKAIATLEEVEDAKRMLPALRLEVLLTKGDWAAIAETVKSATGTPDERQIISLVGQSAAKNEQAPAELKKTVAERLAELLKDKGQAYEYQTLARLQWTAGDKEAALATAKRSVESAKELEAKMPSFPTKPYERFAEALEKGELPSVDQMNDWTREEMQAKQAAAKKAAPKEGADG
jgi:thiol-disulfide isomerase/thioredoxin